VLDLLREIVNAIKVIKKGKAAGTDNIPAEVLKVDPYISALFYSHYFKIFGRPRRSLRNGRKEL